MDAENSIPRVTAKPRSPIGGETPIPALPKKPVLEKKQPGSPPVSVSCQKQHGNDSVEPAVAHTSQDTSVSQATRTQQSSGAPSSGVFLPAQDPLSAIPKISPNGRPPVTKTPPTLPKAPPAGKPSIKPKPLQLTVPAQGSSDVTDAKNVVSHAGDSDKAIAHVVQSDIKTIDDYQITCTGINVKDSNGTEVKSSYIKSKVALPSSAPARLTTPTAYPRTSHPTYVKPKPIPASRNTTNSLFSCSNSAVPKGVQNDSELLSSPATAPFVSNKMCNVQTNNLDSTSGNSESNVLKCVGFYSSRCENKLNDSNSILELKELLSYSNSTVPKGVQNDSELLSSPETAPFVSNKMCNEQTNNLDSTSGKRCDNKLNDSNSILELKGHDNVTSHKTVQLDSIKQEVSETIVPCTRERHEVSPQDGFTEADGEVSSENMLQQTYPKPAPRQPVPFAQPRPVPRKTVSPTILCKTEQTMLNQSESNEHLSTEVDMGATSSLIKDKSENTINSSSHEFDSMPTSADIDNSEIETQSPNTAECDAESSTQGDSCGGNTESSPEVGMLTDQQRSTVVSNKTHTLEAAKPHHPKPEHNTLMSSKNSPSESDETVSEAKPISNSTTSQSREASSLSSTGCDIDNALTACASTQEEMSISDSNVNIMTPSSNVASKNSYGMAESSEPAPHSMLVSEHSDGLKNEAVGGIVIQSDSGSGSHSTERVSSSESDEENEEKITRKKEKKIFMIAREVASSEKVFVDVLVLLNEDFRKHITMATEENGSPVIPSAILNGILAHLPPLQHFSEGLLHDLDACVRNWEQCPRLASIFVKQGRFLLLYSSYIRDFEKMTSTLNEAMKKYPAFAAALKEFEKSPRCASLALKHYMLKPIQRIPQYKMLLTDYMKHLSPDSAEMKDTQTALANVSEVAQHANEAFRQADDAEKMLTIQRSLSGQFEVMKPGRIFLKEGELMKLSRKEMQPRFFFLFSDVLLYTTQVATGYRIGHILSLAGMKVKETDHDDYKMEFSIITEKRSFTLQGTTLKERDDWVTALNNAIRENALKRGTFDSIRPGAQAVVDKDFKLGEKPPVWIPDSRVSMCMLCTCDFTLTWRRHHCRACGKIVCGTCSEKTAPLKHIQYKEARVCDDCYKILVTDYVDGKVTTQKKPARRRGFLGMFKLAADEEGVCISGYLYQLDKGKKWKKMWYIIKDNALYWFKASKDRKPENSMALVGYEVTRLTEEVEDVDPSLLFQLSHPNLEPVVFHADSAAAAEKWMTRMREASSL